MTDRQDLKLVTSDSKDKKLTIQEFIRKLGSFSNLTAEDKDRVRLSIALDECVKHYDRTGERRIILDGKTRYFNYWEMLQFLEDMDNLKEAHAND